MSRNFPNNGNNYFDVGDFGPIDITGTVLTLAGWFKPNAVNASQDLLCKRNNAGTVLQYELRIDSTGKAYFLIGNGGNSYDDAVGATTLSTGAWQHMAGVKSGTGASAVKVYLNGSQDGADTSNLSIGNTTLHLTIGRMSDSTQFPFNGLLAELAIWDIDLSALEVAALAKGLCPLMFRRDHLKGYWPLFGIGTNEPDLSGNGAIGTLNGSVAQADHAPVGRLVAGKR